MFKNGGGAHLDLMTAQMVCAAWAGRSRSQLAVPVRPDAVARAVGAAQALAGGETARQRDSADFLRRVSQHAACAVETQFQVVGLQRLPQVAQKKPPQAVVPGRNGNTTLTSAGLSR